MYLALSVSKPVIPMSEEGQRVLAYAISQHGHKVKVRRSDGLCWALAEAALEAANAQTSTEIHGAKLRDTVDYRWGTEIELGQVRPGDIIQFLKGYGFVEQTTRALDGAQWDSGIVGPIRSHHTAIVEKFMVPGVAFQVLHQHWGGRKKVERMVFYFKKYSYTDTVGNTVSVRVNGKAKFYRPRRKP